MNIAVVHSRYRETLSGENRIVDLQAIALKEMGFSTDLIYRQSPTSPGIIYKIGSSYRVATGYEPLNQIDQFQKPYDFLFVHNTFPNFGFRELTTLNTPIIKWWHNYRFTCANGLFLRGGKECTLCLEDSAFKSIRYGCYDKSKLKTIPWFMSQKNQNSNFLNSIYKHVVLSEDMKNALIDYGVSIKKIAVIPNFVKDLPFELVNPQTSFEIGTNLPQNYTLFLGRLEEEKGIDRLLKSWPKNENLVVLGNGTLQSIVKKHAEENRNITYLGEQFGARLNFLINRSELGVIPSICREGLPTSALEFLRGGKPILTYQGNSFSKTADSLNVGSVFPEFTEFDISNAISRVRAEYSKISAKAMQAYEKHFSLSVWKEQITNLVKEPIL